MKNSKMPIALLVLPLALAACESTRSMSQKERQSGTTTASQVGPYTSDRFDNRDQRSNSLSTPAYPGADQSSLGPDITSSDYPGSTSGSVTQDRMTGTSTPPPPAAAGAAATPPPPATGATTPPPTGTDAQAQQAEKQATTTTKKKVKRVKKSGGGQGATVTPPAAEQPAAQTPPKSGSSSTWDSSQSESGTSTMSEDQQDLSAGVSTTDESQQDISSEAATESELSGSGTVSAGPTQQVPIHTYEKDERVSGSSTEHMDKSETHIKSGGSKAMMKGKESMGAEAGTAAGSTSGMTGETSSAAATAQNTARTQKETDLISQIRSEIVNNKNLSANAHNVKIISQNGQILLRGPVADANEKLKVEEIAKRIAGNTMVINQTTITARSGTSTESKSKSEKSTQ